MLGYQCAARSTLALGGFRDDGYRALSTPVLRAAGGGWQVLAQGLEHSGAAGLLQGLVARFGCRAVFLAHGISQKYNY